MGLFNRMAQQALQTLSKGDIEQPINSALERMLSTMAKEETEFYPKHGRKRNSKPLSRVG